MIYNLLISVRFVPELVTNIRLHVCSLQAYAFAALFSYLRL